MNDEEYRAWLNDPKKAPKERLFPRQALHCYQVSFMHPFLCREITVLAPLAEDMQAFISGKNA
jgi:23S rRNA-/tRNA-specific pseudouridylate synthase